jgi:tetratricopeptide (TPR) repeat protein
MISLGHEEQVRSLLSELPPGKDSALFHLLSCDLCREWALQWLIGQASDPEGVSYDGIWDRLTDQLPQMIEEARRRSRKAEGLLDELLSFPGDEQGAVLQDPRFWSADLLERLLEACQEAQPEDSERSEALAHLALQLTGHLRTRTDELLSAMFFTRASVLRANALRLRGRLVEAEDALGRAAHFLLWPFESSDRAAYCRALALLRWEQGHLDEAEALLRQAARSFREYLLPQDAGACWALLGLLLLEHNRTEEAVRCLQTGRVTLAPAARPWLTVRSGLGLALALADLGQADRAQALLRETWRHYGRVRDEVEQARASWLEGKILYRIGRWEEAEAILFGVRDRFLAVKSLPEAALCSLDLAALLLESGRNAELPQLLSVLEQTFPADPAGLEGLRRAYHAFLASLQGVKDLPRTVLGMAETALRRVLQFRGYRVERLPFA